MKNALFAALLLAAVASASPASAATPEQACAKADNKANCVATLKYLEQNFKPGADPDTAPDLPKGYDTKYATDPDQKRFLIMAKISQGLRSSYA